LIEGIDWEKAMILRQWGVISKSFQDDIIRKTISLARGSGRLTLQAIHFCSLFELALGFRQRKVAQTRPGRRHTPVHRHGTQASSHVRCKKQFSQIIKYRFDCGLELGLWVLTGCRKPLTPSFLFDSIRKNELGLWGIEIDYSRPHCQYK